MSDVVLSDAELLELWAQGERAAGNELIERHFASLYRFFLNKVGDELEDLVQQTLLACVEARARYEGRANFKTFLLGIARFQLYTHYAQRKRQALDTSITSLHDLGASPTSAVARGEDERLILRALQHVSLDTQVLLELIFWEGLEVVEAARVLDLPLNTVYSRLRRAKRALRQKLRELAPERTDLMSDTAQTMSDLG
jgi:RNA polymerase sigma-70 factor (ECF subfamily)